MSSFVSTLWLIIITIYMMDAIDIENSHSVSKWWYQLLLHNTGSSPVSTVYVRSYGSTEYDQCKLENWPPYPWTCERNDTNPYFAPLTVKLTNLLGQQVIINDIIQSFTGSTRYNTTYSFQNQPTTTTTTIKPTISPTVTPTTKSPTLSPNTDPTTSPITASPTLPTISPTNIPTLPTNIPTTTSTTATTPDTPFLGSTLKWPYYVGYINTVLCDIGNDRSCLASIGLPGYARSVPHQYNVLNFGSYIIKNDAVINALQFWFNPTNYLDTDTITLLTGSPTSSNAEIRIILHNMYAQYGIKIFLSTFGEEDDDTLDIEIIDNWMEHKMSPSSIGYKLASIVRDYYFDGININFDTESRYFDKYSTGEQNLIILTEALNSALNRNSLNPYFIITHTASNILFEKSINYPMGGYLMIHEFCDVINWYNIKFYDSGNMTYNTFNTLFVSQNTSIYKLILGDNKQNVIINGAQIVITRSANYEDLNGYLPATTFSNIIKQAVSRGYPYWRTGFMVYDFYNDEEDGFLYSSELIKAFLPTPEPTEMPIIVTKVQYPTVPRYTAETDDSSFDLLNLNSYGWGEWFFLITMFIVLAICCVIIGCCYHRYKVKDKILTDEQLKDLEDDTNRTAISDSWRRLSKLLVRSPTIDAVAMNEEQATRVLGQSIYGNKQKNIELTDQLEQENNNNNNVIINGLDKNQKSIDQINEEDLEELVGRSVDKETENIIPINPEQHQDHDNDDDDDNNHNLFPMMMTITDNDGDGGEEIIDNEEDNTEETPYGDNSSNTENVEDNDEIETNLEGNEKITITSD